MKTKLDVSYQAYKEKMEKNSDKFDKVVSYSFFISLLISIPFLLLNYTINFSIHPHINVVHELSFSNPISFILVVIVSVIASLSVGGLAQELGFIEKIPTNHNAFVLESFKQKYAQCIWFKDHICFQYGDKFYKVEKIREVGEHLEIISVETSPFRIDIL